MFIISIGYPIFKKQTNNENNAYLSTYPRLRHEEFRDYPDIAAGIAVVGVDKPHCPGRWNRCIRSFRGNGDPTASV